MPENESLQESAILIFATQFFKMQRSALNYLQNEIPATGAVRLLKKKDAAAYCSISVPTFDKLCPVLPLSMGPGGSSIRRYDRVEIDRWIDGLRGLNDNSAPSKEAILSRLDI